MSDADYCPRLKRKARPTAARLSRLMVLGSGIATGVKVRLPTPLTLEIGVES
jgi:hypothetical protein